MRSPSSEINLCDESVRPANVSQFEGASRRERDQIKAAIEALHRFGYTDWIRVLDSIIYSDKDDRVLFLKEKRAIFNQRDPLPGLKDQLRGEPVPYAGVAGWRSDPEHGPEEIQYVYVAVWVHDGFQIALFPLTQAVQWVDTVLSLKILTSPVTPTSLLAPTDPFVREEIGELSDDGTTRIPLRQRLVRMYDNEAGQLFVEGLSPVFVGTVVVVLMRPGRISSAGSATAFSPCTERDRSIAPSRRTGSGGSSADSSTSRLTANLGPCAFSGSGLSPRLLHSTARRCLGRGLPRGPHPEEGASGVLRRVRDLASVRGDGLLQSHVEQVRPHRRGQAPRPGADG